MKTIHHKLFLAMLAVFVLCGGAAMAAPPAKVLIAPFDSSGPADKAWIAKAVQQNLVAELSRVNSVEAVTHDKPIADKESALKVAKDLGADYVVLGAYQINDADLRITGQVVDVSKKQAVAGLKATGMQRDLFGLEDVIATQVKRSLPAPVAAVPEMLVQPPAVAPAPAVAAAPVVAPFGPDRVADLNRAIGRINDLDERIERAMDRLRYLDSYTPAYNYGYQSYYPYGFGPYYSGYGYGYGQTNVAIIGGWNGRHSRGHFNVGGTGSWAGARPDGRNYSVPTGNYAVHPGNYIKAVGR